MSLTKKELDLYKDLDERFKKRLALIINNIEEITTGIYPHIEDIESHEFYKNTISAKVYEESGCGCCPGEYDYYDIPESYIYDFDVKKFKNEVEDKKAKELEKENELKEKQLKRNEEKEREMLKFLQEKYC